MTLNYTAPNNCMAVTGKLAVQNNGVKDLYVDITETSQTCHPVDGAICTINPLPFGTYNILITSSCFQSTYRIDGGGNTITITTYNGQYSTVITTNSTYPNIGINVGCY